MISLSSFLLGGLVFGVPLGIALWIGGRADWTGERNYWRQRAEAKPVPAILVPAIPVGTQAAGVVIDAGQRPALEQEAA